MKNHHELSTVTKTVFEGDYLPGGEHPHYSSAFEMAVANGFEGDECDWLVALTPSKEKS